jgi:hypothetical protein
VLVIIVVTASAIPTYFDMRPVPIAWFFLSLVLTGSEGCGSSHAPPVSAATPEVEADRVLAIAQDMERQGNTKQAFAAYHQIIRNFPDTSSGKKAISRVKKAQSATRLKPGKTKT